MNELEIEELLASSLIGRLAMASADGRPYAIPLPFCWLEGALYLRLPLTGRKGQVLRENDQVCFEVDTYSPTLDEYASVLIEGRLMAVQELETKQAVKAANDEKYNRLRRGYRPGHRRPSNLAALPLQKIVVTSLSGRKKEASLVPALAGEGI